MLTKPLKETSWKTKTLFPASFLRILPFFLIGFGCLIQLVQYFSNRSLWGDEAKLALNVIDRSYLELFQVLDYDQVAPIGFLLVEKLSVQLFGDTAYALRLFPLISGLLSLGLFYLVAKRYLEPITVAIATALFAFHPRLIYYSSEVKQYAIDVMVALLIYVVIDSQNQPLTRHKVVTFSVVGALAVWLSHPSVFILASVAVIHGVPYLSQWIRTRKFKSEQVATLKSRVVVFVSWAISFGLFYWISLHSNSSNDTLLDSWSERRSFPEFFPDLDWLFYSTKRFFRQPLDFPAPLVANLAIASFAIGFFSLLWKRRITLLALTLPIAMTFAAAYLYKYPFYSRVVTFLIPFFIMLMAAGIGFLITLKLPYRTPQRLMLLLGIGLAVTLLYVPVRDSSRFLIRPQTDEEIKPLLNYVQQHWQPNDQLYIFQKSKFQFQFHNREYGFQNDQYMIGVDPDQIVEEGNVRELRRFYRRDTERFCGQSRVWVLVADFDMRPDTEVLLNQFDAMGQQIDEFRSRGLASFVQLYDLSACGGQDERSSAPLVSAIAPIPWPGPEVP